MDQYNEHTTVEKDKNQDESQNDDPNEKKVTLQDKTDSDENETSENEEDDEELANLRRAGGSKCTIPQEFLCCNDDVIFFSEKKWRHRYNIKIPGLHLEPP